MKKKLKNRSFLLVVISVFMISCNKFQPNTENTKTENIDSTEMLPSWNEGATKNAIAYYD